MSDPAAARAADLVRRQFKAARPDQNTRPLITATVQVSGHLYDSLGGLTLALDGLTA